MPLEQYSTIIERLKAEEEQRRFQQEQQAQEAARLQSLLQSQTSTGAGQGSVPPTPGLDPTQYFNQARTFLESNPPPQPTTTQRFFDMLGRVGDRMQGHTPRPWSTPVDPLKKLRDTVAEQVVTQGLQSQSQRQLEEEKFKREHGPAALQFKGAEKMLPRWTPQEQLDAYTAQAYADVQNARTAASRARNEAERNATLNALSEAETRLKLIEEENLRTAQPLQKTIIDRLIEEQQGKQSLSQPPPGVPPGSSEVPFSQALEELSRGAPARVLGPQGQTLDQQGFVLGGGSTTAPVSQPAPPGPLLFGSQPSPLSQAREETRTKTNISIDPRGGMSFNLSEEPTPAARLQAERDKAVMTRLESLPDATTRDRMLKNWGLERALTRLESVYDPKYLGLLTNAFHDWKAYSGKLATSHAEMYAIATDLKDRITRIRTGASGGTTGPEAERMNQIALTMESGSPQAFLAALKRIKDDAKNDLDMDLGFLKGGIGGMEEAITQGRAQFQQAHPQSPAMQQATGAESPAIAARRAKLPGGGQGWQYDPQKDAFYKVTP